MTTALLSTARLLRLRCASAVAAMLVVVMLAAVSAAQDDAPGPLVSEQERLSQQFERFEQLLLRLADVEAAENPERAALLRRASRQARERFILNRLQDATGDLDAGRFSDAIQKQQVAREGMAEMLKLLLSEDRGERIRRQRERFEQMIRDIERLQRSQRATRGRTENGADFDSVQRDQEDVNKRAEELQERIEDEAAAESQAEAGSAETEAEQTPTLEEPEPNGDRDRETAPDDEEPGEQEPRDREPSDEDPGDRGSQEGETERSESQQGERAGEPSQQGAESEQGQQGQQQQGQQQQGQQQQGQQQQGQQQQGQQQQGQQQQGQQQPATPEERVGEQLKQAREEMERAREELEQARREEAVEAQREAEERLRQAVEELEQILRQLREEEVQRTLARVETRLRGLLESQTKLRDTAGQLDAIPEGQRDRNFAIRAGNVGFEQRKLAGEADQVVLLLEEEGSARAFPEVLMQVRDDMLTAADRFAAAKVDVVTLGLQDDVISALEEMIEAFRREQMEQEQRRQQQQSGQAQSGQQGEQPLIDPLAELRLIRLQEIRIQGTTKRYADLLNGDAAAEVAPDELQPRLQELADRQTKIYRIVRDLIRQSQGR